MHWFLEGNSVKVIVEENFMLAELGSITFDLPITSVCKRWLFGRYAGSLICLFRESKDGTYTTVNIRSAGTTYSFPIRENCELVELELLQKNK